MPDQSPSQVPAFRVLVVVSRPLDLQELPTIADQWALVNGLASVKTPAYLHILRPPTIESLRIEIRKGYDILHFDGHGSFALRCPNCSAFNPSESHTCWNCQDSLEREKPGGYLVFEREDGRQDVLAAKELAEMLQAVPGSPTKLVFISACESAAGGAESLTITLQNYGTPAVLGMKNMVGVNITVALSRAFYAALGAGMTIAEAFKVSQIALSRYPDLQGTQTKISDIPTLQGPGIGARMVMTPVRGSLIMERERLFGVPEYDFVGEYIPGYQPKGRKGLLSRATDALLGGEKLVVLTGQGGIGKSLLAAVAARRISWRYPGGVFWRSAVDMKLGLNELLDAFASIFGHKFRALPLETKQDVVLGYLGDLRTPCLLVIDGAENVKDPALWRFIEGLPHPSVALVTSREALIREGMQIKVGQMEPKESISLFITEARRRSQRWGESLNLSERDALDKITQLLEGHPLGIKLAAALISIYPLEGISQVLSAAPPNEVSNRFDFSYITLTESQRELLHRIAIFSSSTAEWAIEAISTSKFFEDDGAKKLIGWREDLGELIRKSFIDLFELPVPGSIVYQAVAPEIYAYRRILKSARGSENSILEKLPENKLRYRLHPLMRHYIFFKINNNELYFHFKRTAHLFLEFLEHSGENYNALEVEHENIMPLANWAHNEKEYVLIKLIAWNLDSYLETRGFWKERRLRLEQALEACKKLQDRSGMAKTMHMLGNAVYLQGDIETAQYLYKESINLSQEISEKKYISKSLHQLGMLAFDTGDLNEARSFYNKSLKINQEIGDVSGMAKSLHQLGILEQSLGNMDEARRLYQESLKTYQELGDNSAVLRSIGQLGILEQAKGNLIDARNLFHESLKISKEMGDKSNMARSLHQLGTLAQANGDLNEARHLYQESLKIDQDLGDKGGVSRSLGQLGILEREIGNLNEARNLFRKSLKISRELGDKSSEARLLHQMGAIAQVNGDLNEAERLLQDSLKIYQDLGDKSNMARSLLQLGVLKHAMGNQNDAMLLLKKSLIIDREIGDKSGMARSLLQLGILEHENGNLKEAGRLLQDSLTIYRDLGDKRNMAWSLYQLGILEHEMGNMEEASHFLQESLKIEQEMSDKSGMARTFHQLGIIAQECNNLNEAQELFQQSQEIFEDLGNHIEAAINLSRLGNIAELNKNFIGAAKSWLTALKIFERNASPYKEKVTRDLVRVFSKIDEKSLDSLIQQFSEIDSLIRQIQDYSRVETNNQKAENLMNQGRWRDGYEILKENKDIFKRLSDRMGFAKTLLYLAISEQMLGDLEKSRWTYKDALQQFKDIDAKGYSITLVNLSRLELQTGLVEDAMKHLKEAETYLSKSETGMNEVNNLLEAAEMMLIKKRKNDEWKRILFDEKE